MGITKSHTDTMALYGLAIASLAGIVAGAATPDCCRQKTVGGRLYVLAGVVDTSGYNCLTNCVYKIEADINDPVEKLFCFAAGDLEVVCGDGGESTEKPGDLCPEERPGFGSACRLPEMTCDYGRQTCCGESSAEYQMECRAGEWNGYYIDTVCMDASHVCANTTTEPGCICPAVFSPVCGADGQTYSNTCTAACGGSTVACEEECPCTTTEPSCSCIEIFDPVCGVDGETYSNSCKAACAGSEVACQGDCPCQ